MDKKIQEKLNTLVQNKKIPAMQVGDRVQVNIKIIEKGKTRIQTFEGIVIAIKGSNLTRTITVRKISYGVGVEKIFPVYSPMIDTIKIVKRGDVRRSKLYYMRDRVGKRSMKIKNAKAYEMVEEVKEEEAKEVEANNLSEQHEEQQPTSNNTDSEKVTNDKEESKRD